MQRRRGAGPDLGVLVVGVVADPGGDLERLELALVVERDVVLVLLLLVVFVVPVVQLIVLSITAMVLFILIVNKLVWQPAYELAQRRFALNY